jgi:hypothetical protein
VSKVPLQVRKAVGGSIHPRDINKFWRTPSELLGGLIRFISWGSFFSLGADFFNLGILCQRFFLLGQNYFIKFNSSGINFGKNIRPGYLYGFYFNLSDFHPDD